MRRQYESCAEGMRLVRLNCVGNCATVAENDAVAFVLYSWLLATQHLSASWQLLSVSSEDQWRRSRPLEVRSGEFWNFVVQHLALPAQRRGSISTEF